MYLIEILHQTTTFSQSISTRNGCILSKFYIKPQLIIFSRILSLSCILSKFYIKPQQCSDCLISFEVVSYRNSTSNHNSTRTTTRTSKVVSYRNSTSNHNSVLFAIEKGSVVSYRNSTSNHNTGTTFYMNASLYLIEILHQTTTRVQPYLPDLLLYLIEILHQTTTCGRCEDCLRRCILSKFYIKPQLNPMHTRRTTCCILSKFYIKPQHEALYICSHRVVSYRNSTSNHNF